MNRLDNELLTRALARSRSHAQQLIKSGRVEYQLAGRWQSAGKPSLKVDAATALRVLPGEEDRFVSRGGLKLAGALAYCDIDPSGQVVLDVGQSTGGFTDCLLQAGASQVVGVDVGHDQLFDHLRRDTRVVCYEGVNARELPATLRERHASDGYALAVMDVSFISQTLIYPTLVSLLGAGGQLVSLVKPQFEVGREGVGKGGIVRDELLYRGVRENIEGACERHGLVVKDYFESPIVGGDGNREFFVRAQKYA